MMISNSNALTKNGVVILKGSSRACKSLRKRLMKADPASKYQLWLSHSSKVGDKL